MKKRGSVTSGTAQTAQPLLQLIHSSMIWLSTSCGPKFTTLSYIFTTMKMGGTRAVCTTVPARIVASLSVVMAALAEVTRFVSLLERCRG